MKKFITIIAVILLTTGCSSLRLTSTWKDSNPVPKTYDKIMVLALIGEPDRTVREKMEEHLAGDLRDLGYDAVTSVKEYGPKAFEGLKEADAINLLHEKGIEAVVTIVLLDKKRERYYVPSRVVHSPYTIYQNRFWPYYSTMYDRVNGPGYYTADTKYFWESNFYDLYEWKLLYSAQGQSFDPQLTESLAHEYGQVIVKDMVKSKVIQNKKAVLKSF